MTVSAASLFGLRSCCDARGRRFSPMTTAAWQRVWSWRYGRSSFPSSAPSRSPSSVATGGPAGASRGCAPGSRSFPSPRRSRTWPRPCWISTVSVSRSSSWTPWWWPPPPARPGPRKWRLQRRLPHPCPLQGSQCHPPFTSGLAPSLTTATASRCNHRSIAATSRCSVNAHVFGINAYAYRSGALAGSQTRGIFADRYAESFEKRCRRLSPPGPSRSERWRHRVSTPQPHLPRTPWSWPPPPSSRTNTATSGGELQVSDESLEVRSVAGRRAGRPAHTPHPAVEGAPLPRASKNADSSARTRRFAWSQTSMTTRPSRSSR